MNGKAVSFYLQGFFVCMVTGNLWKYSYLIAQAKHECRDDFSGVAFGKGNPWAMKAGPLTSRRSEADTSDGPDGGFMCHYRTFTSAWLDRLGWDTAKGIKDRKSVAGYYLDVVNGNWLGYNVSNERKAQYVQGCMNQYTNNTPGWTKLMDADETGGGKPWWSRTMWSLFYLLLFLLFLFAVLYLLWRILKGTGQWIQDRMGISGRKTRPPK